MLKKIAKPFARMFGFSLRFFIFGLVTILILQTWSVGFFLVPILGLEAHAILIF